MLFVRATIRQLLSREINWLLAAAARLMRFHLLTMIFIMVGSALALIDPLILKIIIDRALPQKQLHLLGLAAGLFCAAFIGRIVCTYAAVWSSTLATQKLIFRTRLGVLRRLNSLPAKYHDASAVGDNLYRLDQDVSRIGELGADVIPTAARMLVMGIMVFATMIFLDGRLTLMVCPLLAAFYFTQKTYYKKLRSISENAQERAGALNALLEEHLNGILQLKLLNRTNTRTRIVARAMADVARINARQRLAEIRFSLGSMAVIAAGNTLILGYGGYQVISGQLTTGTLVAFYGYLLRLFEPLVIATDLQARGQRVGASIRRILDILDSHRRSRLDGPRHAAQEPAFALEFREVCFSYRENRPVLNKVSFRIRPGEKVAFVGVNGSGKSTIGQIASGLYRADDGSVFVNGADIEAVSWGKLSTSISLVPQDPVVFSGTIRENVLYGNPAATELEIETAAKLVRFDEVVRRFPRGMDELLGPKGKRLSGGERKRLALARAMLQNPQILILDEVTAALDGPAAESVLHNLDRTHHKHRVLILITHRPATIRWANRILVVEGGAIIDDGTHDELMRRCLRYRQIYVGALHSRPSTEESLCS
jgi:ABC-type bacteriocin/lantibiotic exporter with double-glycine peptidase domain